MPVELLHFHGDNGALQSQCIKQSIETNYLCQELFIIKLLEELLQPELY